MNTAMSSRKPGNPPVELIGESFAAIVERCQQAHAANAQESRARLMRRSLGFHRAYQRFRSVEATGRRGSNCRHCPNSDLYSA